MTDLTIKLSVWDAGCLPGVLREKIGSVEQHIRVCGDRYSADSMKHTNDFLGQLRGCLAAVEEARGVPVKTEAQIPPPPYPGAAWCLDCKEWDDRSDGRSHHVGHRLTHLPEAE